MDCFWTTGLLVCWNAGQLDWWTAGLLDCWNAGLLDWWTAGLDYDAEDDYDADYDEYDAGDATNDHSQWHCQYY